MIDFFYIENFGSEPCLQIYTNGDGDQKDNSIKKQQKIEGQLRNILYKAIKDSAEEDTGWASVSKIGIYLSQTQPDFDPRSHGYAKLSGMLKALGGLQFRYDESTRMYCRKVPYLELRAIINEAMPKFQNKQGWAKINAMEKYIKLYQQLLSLLSLYHFERTLYAWQRGKPLLLSQVLANLATMSEQ